MTDATGEKRLAGLDIFRGLAVAGMVVVNNPGSWSHVWWPLDHAPWHGWTPTDLIFPAFLFAVGVALGLSYPRAFVPAERRAMWLRIARRALALIGLGLIFAFLAHPSLETLRLPGVLQRIGLCYAAVASLALATSERRDDGRVALNIPAIAVATVLSLLSYWVMIAFIPVPGHGAGNLSPAGNIAGYVDRAVLTTSHMWRLGTDAAGHVVYDPEGLLSTLPALSNVLFGMLAAAAWKRAPGPALAAIAWGGAALTAGGLLLDPVMPINKRLWTPSFALFSSGVAALVLVLAILASRRDSLRRAAAPFTILGMNAILGYLMALGIGILGSKPLIPAGRGGHATLPEWGFAHLDGIFDDALLASATYGLIALAIVLLILLPLHRRGIFLRL